MSSGFIYNVVDANNIVVKFSFKMPSPLYEVNTELKLD